MEQRDLLKDQIEQLGKALAKIMSAFLGLKSGGSINQGIEISNERLQSELDIDIQKLITLNKAKLKEYVTNLKLSEGHLEILSEYLKEIGMVKIEANKDEAKLCLEKALELLDLSDEISNSLSFDRINKKTKIENFLQQNL